MLEIAGTFRSRLVALDRQLGMTGRGRLVATAEGLRIQGRRRAPWASPMLGCVLPLLMAVGFLMLGMDPRATGRLIGRLVLPAAAGGWVLGWLIAPRRPLDLLVPWAAIGDAWMTGRTLAFHVRELEPRGVVMFEADGTSPEAFLEIARRAKSGRWEA